MLNEHLRRRIEALNRGPLSSAATPPRPAAAPRDAPVALPAANARPAGATRKICAIPGLVRRGEEVRNAAGRHWRILLPIDVLWPGGERLVEARHAFLRHLFTPTRPMSEGDQREPGIGGKNLPHRGSVPAQPTIDSRDAQPPGESHSPPSTNDSRQPPQTHAVGRASPPPIHADLAALISAFPKRSVFLDLETCGLAGAAIFLVGMLRRINGHLVVELLLARNYREEKAVLVSLWQIAARHDVLVTFNGKSFDWPMVHDRSTRFLLGRRVPEAAAAGPLSEEALSSTLAPLSRETPRPELLHIDLLHHARRMWRRRLPDCKLQTIERHICGRLRQGDIPGWQIPAAYQQFVSTGQEQKMDVILFHNALDLVTLLDVAMRVAA